MMDSFKPGFRSRRYELHFSSQRIEYCVYSISLISNLHKTFSFLSLNLKMK